MKAPQKLTALRAVDLLHRTESGLDHMKIKELREAVRDHLKALVRPKKRRVIQKPKGRR